MIKSGAGPTQDEIDINKNILDILKTQKDLVPTNTRVYSRKFKVTLIIRQEIVLQIVSITLIKASSSC